MPMIKLSLENLAKVRGGLVAIMVEKALLRMAEDLERAPDIAEWRTVTLEIAAKPLMENRELSDVDVEFRVKGKVPTRVASSRMAVRRGPNAGDGRTLMFAEDSDDDPNQLTFSDLPSQAVPVSEPDEAE